MKQGYILFGFLFAFLALSYGGVAGLVPIGLALGGIWWFSMIRARLAVRAYVYLAERQSGASVEEANKIASRIDTNAASYMVPDMMEYARTVGGQLGLISAARIAGFSQ